MNNMRDPYDTTGTRSTMNDPTTRPDPMLRDPVEPTRSTPWGWIGAGLLVAVLLLMFAFTGNDRTASTNNSPGSSVTQTTSPASPNTGSAGNTGAAPRTSAPAATPPSTSPSPSTSPAESR